MIIEMPTRMGSPTSLSQNPSNAILHIGHQNGTVTLWSPNSTTPLVKMLAHKGPVRATAVDREGRLVHIPAFLACFINLYRACAQTE